jgi:hypothetical protein
MSRVRAKVILDALQTRIAAIKLGPESGDEPLCEAVEIFANKSLGEALEKLIITKQRVCFIVPTGMLRTYSQEISGEVTLLSRFLAVTLILADRSYVKAEQVALVGGEKNVGVLPMSELLEDALDGEDLSPYGPALFDDGASDEVSVKKDVPGRVAWFQALLIPAGDNR